jgi:hypothetical protein
MIAGQQREFQIAKALRSIHRPGLSSGRPSFALRG